MQYGVISNLNLLLGVSNMNTTMIVKLNPEIFSHQIIFNNELFKFMYPIFNKSYPQFDKWYFNKVKSGFNNGKRSVFIIKNGSDIYGVSIIKKSSNMYTRNKICSFFVLPEMNKNGLGTELMKATVSEYSEQTCGNNIIITVPEDRLFQMYHNKNFYTFLKINEFKIVNRVVGKYRPGYYEYIFSRAKVIAINQSEYIKIGHIL